MTDLTALLKKNSDEIKPPATMPPGQYTFRVKSWKSDRKSQNGNPILEFDVEALAPIDVDSNTLEGIEFPVSMGFNFTLTEKSLFRVRDFAKNCGVATDGRDLESIINDTPGHVFRGNITQRPTQKDPTRFFAEISDTYPAD